MSKHYGIIGDPPGFDDDFEPDDFDDIEDELDDEPPILWEIDEMPEDLGNGLEPEDDL